MVSGISYLYSASDESPLLEHYENAELAQITQTVMLELAVHGPRLAKTDTDFLRER